MSTKLKPLKIGNIQVDLPVTLASLAGYSDLPYRTICRQMGAQYCGTEMMLDRLLLAKGRWRSRMLHSDEGDHPLSGQLVGNEPDVMAAAAVELCKLGFDVIDLNFACPVKKALRRRRGGWMMREPDLAGEIVRAVIAAVDRPVTLKLRRSFSEADESNDAFWQIAESAFDSGAAAICVHGRSVEARYTGLANWEFIASVKRRFSDRTVMGSGDALTPADAIAMMDQTCVDGVIAARGVIGNPWFFQQVRDISQGRQPYQPTIAQQRKVICEHFRLACEFYGSKKGPRVMRKFGIKYSRMHTTPKKLRLAYINVKTPEQWNAVLEEFYADK